MKNKLGKIAFILVVSTIFLFLTYRSRCQQTFSLPTDFVPALQEWYWVKTLKKSIKNGSFELTRDTTNYLLKKYPYLLTDTLILHVLQRINPNFEKSNFVKDMVRGKISGKYPEPLTQSEACLISEVSSRPHYQLYPYVKDSLEDPRFYYFLYYLNNLERESIRLGYSVFIHGQRKKYAFANDLYTELVDKIVKYPVPKNFIFLRAQSKEELSHHTSSSEHKQENNQQPKNPSDDLFVNAFIPGNCRNASGASSLEFFYSGSNIDRFTKDSDLITVFEKLSLAHLYYRYRKEIEALEKKYLQLSYGRLLQIAIPNSLVNNCVRLSLPCGDDPGQVVDLQGNIYRATDTLALLQNIRKRPGQPVTFIQNGHLCSLDQLEFVINLKAGLLNPHSGIKILHHEFERFSVYNTAPLEKYQEEFDALIAKMARDEEEQNKKTA